MLKLFQAFFESNVDFPLAFSEAFKVLNGVSFAVTLQLVVGKCSSVLPRLKGHKGEGHGAVVQ